MRMKIFLSLELFFLMISFSLADEMVESRIQSLGVFKNGNVFVQEEISVPTEGRFILKSPPSPILGTFFIESNALVSTKLTETEITLPLFEVDFIKYPDDLLGLDIQIKLDGEMISGRIVHFQKKLSTDSSRFDSYSDRLAYSDYYNPAERFDLNDASKQNAVIFEKADGSQIIISDWNNVQNITIPESNALKTIKKKVPVLVFDVQQASNPQQTSEIERSSNIEQVSDGKHALEVEELVDNPKIAADSKVADGSTSAEPMIIRLSYLTKGIAWTPSYKINMSESEKISLEQIAVLVNEWKDFENVSVSLISGFPQIQFDNVLSPMSPNVNLESFFASLSRQNMSRNSSSINNNNITTQQMVMMNAAPTIEETSTISDPSAISSDEQPDTFYQNIGIQSLKKNERLQLIVAKESVPFERIVCWDIPDIRDENGRIFGRNDNRFNNNYGRTTSGKVRDSQFREPWDVLRFKNPFDFPMTTGPVSIFGNEKFYGQNLTFWYNPNEEVKVQVNKALSVRVDSSETERTEYDVESLNSKNIPKPVFQKGGDFFNYIKKNAGNNVQLNGDVYRIAIIDAVISLENLRNNETNLLLRRELSGELLPESLKNPGDNPKIKTSTQGGNFYNSSRINRLHELSWDIKLQPGEKKLISFSYILLVR